MILQPEGIAAIALFVPLSLTFTVAVVSLVRDGLRKATNVGMLLCIAMMYTISTVVFGIELAAVKRHITYFAGPDGVITYTVGGTYDDKAAYHFTGYDSIGILISAIFGDAIILWRVIVIWPHNKPVRWISLALYFLTLSLSIGNTVFLVMTMEPYPPTFRVFVGLSLMSNIWATSVIGARAWRYRSMLQRQIAIVSRRSALEKALNLLTETGFIYCIIWAVYFISQFWNVSSAAWFSIILWFAVPLYPMLIVLLVARRKTVLEEEALTTIEVQTKVDTPENDRGEYLEVDYSGHERKWDVEPWSPPGPAHSTA